MPADLTDSRNFNLIPNYNFVNNYISFDEFLFKQYVQISQDELNTNLIKSYQNTSECKDYLYNDMPVLIEPRQTFSRSINDLLGFTEIPQLYNAPQLSNAHDLSNSPQLSNETLELY